jgi:hypothetical protein
MSPEDSFEDEMELEFKRDSLKQNCKLPTRAQSLNYPKSPNFSSPRIPSPSPGEVPGNYTSKPPKKDPSITGPLSYKGHLVLPYYYQAYNDTP